MFTSDMTYATHSRSEKHNARNASVCEICLFLIYNMTHLHVWQAKVADLDTSLKSALQETRGERIEASRVTERCQMELKCVRVRVYVNICMDIYLCIYMYVYIYMCDSSVGVSVYMSIYVCIYNYVYVCMYIYKCVNMCIYVFMWIYVCIYIYI